mmetsp:Transcript_88474/g.205845  ORF Transcript_88474/g.205845 Transcript_88474/m.205845 type:complete len:567 (+) Transcript_88474:115-1815(+)
MADEEEIWEGHENWEGWESDEQRDVEYDSDLLFVNPKAYSRWPLTRFVAAAHDGELDLLAKMLDRDNPIDGFHADINWHVDSMNALQAAAVNGQLEAVELLLGAKADPHVKTTMSYGKDPHEGETARDLADKWGWDDIVNVLKRAELETPRGVYRRYGTGNNAKLWPIDKPQGLDPAQEKRAMKKYKGMLRPVPRRADRKFYGDVVYGITHGYDDHGNLIRGRWGAVEEMATPASVDASQSWEPWAQLPTTALSVVATSTGLLFPGHGSQYVTMMQEVQQKAGVRQMLAIANEVLDFDVLAVCLGGPEGKLDQPRILLPALYIANLAGIEKLREQAPEAVERPGALAGLFIGEYTALTVGGVWDFKTGLELAKACGDAVAAAVEEAPQATASVAGLDKVKLQAYCEQARVQAGASCQVSIELFPKGFVCAGGDDSIQALKKITESGGALQCKIQRALGAIHSPFMASARESLRHKMLDALPKMRPPRCDIYMNSTGKAFRKGSDPKDVIPLLCDALTAPVLWEKCVSAMISSGIDEFYEVGPSKQLKAMMKRIDSGLWSRTKNIEI